MGLFSKKKKKEEKPVAKKQEVTVDTKKVTSTPTPTSSSNVSVLLRPHITEKATDSATDNNAYVFEVTKNATKPEIAKAIKAYYNVIPRKINIARTASKKTTVRGRVRGTVPSIKKAYVYLKEGDTIEFV